MKMSLKVCPSTACIMCGKEGNIFYNQLVDRLHDTPGEYDIYYCASCELAWLSPIPLKEDIAKCYVDDYYTHTPASIGRKSEHVSSLKRLVRLSILNQWYNYKYQDASGTFISLIGKLLGLIPFLRNRAYYDLKLKVPWRERGKLLDVGCGNGAYLLMMRELGWQVEGIDIDPQAVKAARESGLTVHVGFLEDHSFPSESFDAITMSHVIEHLLEPMQTLKECYRILKPGGYLAIATPNFRSLLHKYFGKNYFALEPPRHTYIFTSKSIRRLISDSGFEVKWAKTIVDKHMFDFCYNMSYQIRKYGKCRYSSKEEYSLFEKAVLKAVEVLTLPILKNGEELIIIAQKKP